MEITVEVSTCLECPYSNYTPEGYFCMSPKTTDLYLPCSESGIPFDCPESECY